MSVFFMYDGKYFSENSAVIGPDSRAFRYGDGLFETIRVSGRKIPLASYHFSRCLSGMDTLGFSKQASFTPEWLQNQILALCEKNKHPGNLRVRMSFFRGNGGMYDVESHRPHYIIQTWVLPDHYQKLNSNGLDLAIYPIGRKSCDLLSNLKSNNALVYTLAARFAQNEKCNEALVLNTANNIADATIANVFWIKDGIIFTNPLTDGLVAGVMRQHIIDICNQQGSPVRIQSISPGEIVNADEIFLTNALYGIRWVGSMGDKKFQHDVIDRLYKSIIIPLFG